MTKNKKNIEYIHSNFWEEIPEKNDAFSARIFRCAGYDVYGDLLGKASWIEYLYLLFHGEQPSLDQARLLNDLAVALANPGPKDCGVQAAMSAGAGGSTLAAALMAALAAGAGGFGGAREVYETIILWQQCQHKLEMWQEHLGQWQNNICNEERTEYAFAAEAAMESVWPPMDHPPGFNPYAYNCSTPVLRLLEHLSQIQENKNLNWLKEHRLQLESIAGCPLDVSGVAGAALADLSFDPQQGELLYLLLRLPGAAAHALEQHWLGCSSFPFYRQGLNITNDPGPVEPNEKLPTT
ncbi:MAG: hypothetical protein P8Y45_22200 [Exilibacterium sp.]